MQQISKIHLGNLLLEARPSLHLPTKWFFCSHHPEACWLPYGCPKFIVLNIHIDVGCVKNATHFSHPSVPASDSQSLLVPTLLFPP